ncbi:acyloxyacyl hydrolase [Nisaea acidiphila]|uniref:Acyloxyacyl hydrolase n=1 Tax=Nisaea acidiphila TaxID=1862145 RepID=A0A9J7AUZ5_9PROT|nr:acyloxyacyl hydrolase [Nisaea acidiphila]UUX51151.1 acyloxyacyl hydrolase [Nisaea acidiphila]
MRAVLQGGIPVKRFLSVATAALAFLVSSNVSVRAEEPAFLSLGAGVYDVIDNETTAEARVEYRFSEQNKLWLFTPFVGFMATAEGATYGYGGIGVDIFFGKRWVLTPNFAAGIYGNGDGKDLGSAIEFRSGVEFAYRFDDYSRLGLTFHHISNAGIDEQNPGTESVMLMYSVPFDKLFGN